MSTDNLASMSTRMHLIRDVRTPYRLEFRRTSLTSGRFAWRMQPKHNLHLRKGAVCLSEYFQQDYNSILTSRAIKSIYIGNCDSNPIVGVGFRYATNWCSLFFRGIYRRRCSLGNSIGSDSNLTTRRSLISRNRDITNFE